MSRSYLKVCGHNRAYVPDDKDERRKICRKSFRQFP